MTKPAASKGSRQSKGTPMPLVAGDRQIRMPSGARERLPIRCREVPQPARLRVPPVCEGTIASGIFGAGIDQAVSRAKTPQKNRDMSQ